MITSEAFLILHETNAKVTANVINRLGLSLTHSVTHTVTHTVTHKILHHYYCIYCYYYGDYCQYCFYYRDYSWLHRMSWTGSALKPNMLGDAPNNEPIKLNLLMNYANKHGAPAVTTRDEGEITCRARALRARAPPGGSPTMRRTRHACKK